MSFKTRLGKLEAKVLALFRQEIEQLLVEFVPVLKMHYSQDEQAAISMANHPHGEVNDSDQALAMGVWKILPESLRSVH